MRNKERSFLKTCFNPEVAAEISLQPIIRFDFDFIISLSSIYGNFSPHHDIYKKVNFFSSISYTAAKSGILGLNKWLAKKFASQNIRSNLISPGGVFNNHSKRFQKNYLKNIPIKRMANQKDVYEVLKFLINDKSNYVNGEILTVDGGWMGR